MSEGHEFSANTRWNHFEHLRAEEPEEIKERKFLENLDTFRTIVYLKLNEDGVVFDNESGWAIYLNQPGVDDEGNRINSSAYFIKLTRDYPGANPTIRIASSEVEGDIDNKIQFVTHDFVALPGNETQNFVSSTNSGAILEEKIDGTAPIFEYDAEEDTIIENGTLLATMPPLGFLMKGNEEIDPDKITEEDIIVPMGSPLCLDDRIAALDVGMDLLCQFLLLQPAKTGKVTF